MPTADITYHSTSGADTPVWGHAAAPMPVLGPQAGSSVRLDFTGGAASGTAQENPVVAVVIADADCRVAIGSGITATQNNSRRIPANLPTEFHVPAGARVSVIGA